MNNIESYPFNKKVIKSLSNDGRYVNWPAVYIINDKKEAYIGETTNLKRRISTHLKDTQKVKLKKLNIITDDDFNKSVALDLESMLIEYIAADGKFKLQNSNNGMRNHNYYNRKKYQKKFRYLWEELKRRDLTTQELFEIRNTDLFKFSPYKPLTEDQFQIVSSIEEIIKEYKGSVSVISGEPGSGKTVLAVYLAKLLISKEETPIKKLGLVLPMTSLRATIRKVFTSISGLRAKMVIGPSQLAKFDEPFDLLIVDESHRLARRRNLSSYANFDRVNEKLGFNKDTGNQLEWVIKSARHVILFYDSKQSVKPSDISEDRFRSIIERVVSEEGSHKEVLRKYKLKSQMRLKAGEKYPKYIESILDETAHDRICFESYDFKLFSNVDKMVKAIKQKNEEVGLSRVVAGYAWNWVTKKQPEAFDININGYTYRWNSVVKDWINSDNSVNEIGCIHTIQGYDLNYCGVIIGSELVMENSEIKFIKANYKDKYGSHRSLSYNQMKEYILNIYKTLLTRGILGTYVYVCDSKLREYISKFVPLV